MAKEKASPEGKPVLEIFIVFKRARDIPGGIIGRKFDFFGQICKISKYKRVDAA